jgi:hypothetical protein
MRRLILPARHNDLVVVARPTEANGLPKEFVERMLAAGRPMIIASSCRSESLTGKIMICWKETAEAARTAGAAMPLLEKAEHVIVASVTEPGRHDTETVSDLVRQAAWHGIHANAQVIAANHQTVCRSAVNCENRILKVLAAVSSG